MSHLDMTQNSYIPCVQDVHIQFKALSSFKLDALDYFPAACNSVDYLNKILPGAMYVCTREMKLRVPEFFKLSLMMNPLILIKSV